MSDFDKEFDAAPDASFDDEFDKAPAIEEKSFLDKESPLGPSLRETGETLHDAALGGTQGIMMNAADEIGGGVSAGLDSLIGKISGYIPGTDAHKLKNLNEGTASVEDLPGLSPELIAKLKGKAVPQIDMPEQSLAENYKMYQQNAEDQFKAAQERSPIAYGGAQIAGGIGSNIAAGNALGVFNAAKGAKPILDVAKDSGKLKAGLELLKRGGTNAIKASPLMALEGVTGSEGSLINGTDGEQAQVGKDVLSNLALGGASVLGMQGISDVAAPFAKQGAQKLGKIANNVFEDSDFLQQMKIMKDYGEQGINPVARKNAVNLAPGQEGLIHREGSRAQGMMDKILEADSKLGKEVGDSLNVAEASGLKFDINPIIDQSFSKVAADINKISDINESAVARNIFNKIATKGSSIMSPTEAKSLLNDVDAVIKKLGKYSAPSEATQDSQMLLQDFREKLDQEMRKQIKPYDLAKTRFNEFRQLVPETIISGETPQDISKVWMGDLKNPEKDLYNRIKGLTKYSTASGSANAPVKEALENTIQGVNKWEALEATRGTKNPLESSAQDMAKQIREYANDAAARRSATTTAEAKAFGTNLATAASGFGQSTRSLALGSANIYGRVGTPIAKKAGEFSRKVYNLPAEKLNQAADRMTAIPGLQTLGKALKQGLESGDSAKKNAALFSIMQNPSASLIFDENEEE